MAARSSQGTTGRVLCVDSTKREAKQKRIQATHTFRAPQRYMTAADAKFLVGNRPERDASIVKALIQRIQKEIRFAASKRGEIDLLYEVPKVLPDYPLFDRSVVAEQLRDHFESQGFFAETYNDIILYVNWL